MSRIIGKNRGIRNASYKSIINVEWFHKHDLNKSTTFYSDFSVYKLFEGYIGTNSAVSLSYNYTTFDYLIFTVADQGMSTIGVNCNASNIRIVNQAEFAAIIAFSKYIGAIVGLARDTATSSANVSFALAINATKSFTSTYWSAGFLQAMHRDNHSTYNTAARVYGIRRK